MLPIIYTPSRLRKLLRQKPALVPNLSTTQWTWQLGVTYRHSLITTRDSIPFALDKLSPSHSCVPHYKAA